MKKWLAAFLCMSIQAAWAGHPVLVYKDAESVSGGGVWIGQLTSEGVLITAEQALDAKTTPLIGLLEGELRHGSLLKLDNQLNAAFMKLGEPVKDKEMVQSHAIRAKQFKSFLPDEEKVPTLIKESQTLDEASQEAAADPETYVVKINGQSISSGTVELPVKRKKSEFELEVVNVSSNSFWRTDVQLRSKPRLDFWKKGRKKGLNDVPRPYFKYFYQAMWKPIKPGDSFKVDVEVVHVKHQDYVWSISLKSKSDLYSRKIPIKFVNAE